MRRGCRVRGRAKGAGAALPWPHNLGKQELLFFDGYETFLLLLLLLLNAYFNPGSRKESNN